MENPEENAVDLHGDEEIIEVIELNDTEPGPGMCQTTLESLPASSWSDLDVFLKK